jgi:hypothetical protein
MTVAIMLFALAAVGGLTLAYLRINNKPLPMPLALIHGAAAAAGLVALLLAVLDGVASSEARIALGLFVAAALGGFTLFSFHVRGKPLPIPLVVVHGLAAVVAFAVLLLAMSKGS